RPRRDPARVTAAALRARGAGSPPPARSPPEGDARAEHASDGRVRGLAALEIDELGVPAAAIVVGSRPHEGETVEVDPDERRDPELEAHAALATEIDILVVVATGEVVGDGA